MTATLSASQLGREYDDFLFAPVGKERNGMTLSVVSALARSNVDPWREAAELARLPESAACQRLATTIGSLPDGPCDIRTIAAHLVSLLPHATASSPRKHQPAGTAPLSSSAIKGAIPCAILLILLLSAELALMGNQPPRLADPAVASASATISPQGQAPLVGR